MTSTYRNQLQNNSEVVCVLRSVLAANVIHLHRNIFEFKLETKFKKGETKTWRPNQRKTAHVNQFKKVGQISSLRGHNSHQRSQFWSTAIETANLSSLAKLGKMTSENWCSSYKTCKTSKTIQIFKHQSFLYNFPQTWRFW